MTNCGLKALEQMTALKNVSMFTLIHLAKDNGVNLYFCKVDPEELVQVTRPAIFHQEDHFVFIKNGDPMPPGEYDGYVLTPKPLHEPIPYSLAKRIKGRKKAKAFIAPIVTGVASFINPMLGAAVGAGFAANQARKTGEWWRVPLSAATGYLQGVPGASTLGINNATLSAGLAAAGEVPGAIKSGNYMAPLTAGLGQYAGAKFIGGAQSGLASAGPGLLSQAGGALKGGVSALTGGAQELASGGVPARAGAGAARGVSELSRGTIGATPAGYSGTYTLPGVANRVVGVPGIAGPAGIPAGAGNLAGGLTTASLPGQSGAGGFNLSNLIGGKGGAIKAIGTAASSLISPPKLETNVTENFEKAAQYLGGDNFKALPSATRKQLEEYVNTPLDQLAEKFYAADDKGMRVLEEKHQKARDAALTRFASFGQSLQTSTDAQRQINEIDRQYDQAKAEYQQQIQNKAFEQAVGFKKDILQKSMEQGQFDYESAMELASYIGRDQEMQYALQAQDHQALQNVLAEIFSIGQQPSQQTSQTLFDQNRGFITSAR